MVDIASPPREMSSFHEPVVTIAGQLRRHVRAQLTRWGVRAELVDDALAQLTRWGVRAELVDDALLVLEELVANVLDHARTPFQLVVRLVDDVLHIGVTDRSVRSPLLRPFDPHAARGRGLQLVSTLALRWGCTYDTEGKTVWAELAA